MKSKIDVLLLARPDHSYTIYKGLLKSTLSFIYCSFKLFPRWAESYIKNPRVRYYDGSYSNCFLLTLFHIYRTKRNKTNLERYEKTLYEWHLSKLLNKVEPKIIHYWPYLSLDKIREYKKKHPYVKTFADVYFPCELWVQENIRPVMAEYGLDDNMTIVDTDAEKMKAVMEFEDNFLVPSQFVADTYREYYPHKNYIIMPYGLTKWADYKVKKHKENRNEVRRFVYAAGGVTVQKGCDYMLRYFKKHQELELHIYGGIPESQKHIFNEYLNCKNIYFHGHIPKSKLQSEVSQYDVGIHLSRYDAYSLAVGEMMGTGLPVIVSDKTGIFFHILKIDSGVVTQLDDKIIEDKINEIRDPMNYNRFVDNLDKYLNSSPKFYEEEILEFYRSNL